MASCDPACVWAGMMNTSLVSVVARAGTMSASLASVVVREALFGSSAVPG